MTRSTPQLIDRKYSTLHVRCGTNFLFIVLFLTIVAHFFMDLVLDGGRARSSDRDPDRGHSSSRRLLLRGHQARNSQRGLAVLQDHRCFPGLALQRITTKPPTLDQIEVAIAAMQAVAADIDSPDKAEEGPEAPVS